MRQYIKWSQEANTFVIDNYLYFTDKQLGELLGKSGDSIRKQRQMLGLKRSKKAMQEVLAKMPIIIWKNTKGIK